MSRLLKVTFDCEVLTPMFLGGADGNMPEFRVPTIRGGMRYWYRALVGGKGEINAVKLAELEEKVFGSSDKGSSVAIQLFGNRTPQTVKGEIYTKDDRGRPGSTGTAYLWYSLTLGQTNNKIGIQAGETFSVTLRGRDQQTLGDAVDSFKLLAAFGGLGSRARRAAGSFRITAIESSFALGQERSSVESYPAIPDTSLSHQPVFNVFNVQYCEVHRIKKEFKSWDMAVEFLGSRMRSFRSQKGRGTGGDYDQVRGQVKSNIPPKKIDRVHFGLPLRFQFSSLKKEVRYNSTNIDLAGSNGENRKASPILFSVGKTGDDYYINVIYFKSKFLPDGGTIKVGRNTTRPGDASIISNFIEELKK